MLVIEAHKYIHGSYVKAMMTGEFELSYHGNDMCWLKNGKSEIQVYLPYDEMKKILLQSYADERPQFLDLMKHSNPYRSTYKKDKKLPEIEFLAEPSRIFKAAATAKPAPKAGNSGM